MTPSDPAATLEEIKERAKEAAAFDVDVLAAFSGVSVGGVIAASAVDVPRLVAALEAVLKEADDFEANRPERLVTRRYAAECFRAAITREITGKGESDAAT